MKRRKPVFETMQMLIELENAILKNAMKYYGHAVPVGAAVKEGPPVPWSFYMMSHFFKFQRDVEGLKDVLMRRDLSLPGRRVLSGNPGPGGGQGLTGSGSSAAVSEKDFLCEIAFHATQATLHIASLADDVIFLNSKESDLVELNDSLATGSSIAPQKKTPGVCEMLRAKSDRAVGRLVSILTSRKALSDSASEMKAVFNEAIEETLWCLEMARLLVGAVAPKDKEGAVDAAFEPASDARRWGGFGCPPDNPSMRETKRTLAQARKCIVLNEKFLDQETVKLKFDDFHA